MTLKQLLNKPEVESISDERDTDDGIWIYLKPGFIDKEAGVHCLHEKTIADLVNKYRYVKPCNCKDCKV